MNKRKLTLLKSITSSSFFLLVLLFGSQAMAQEVNQATNSGSVLAKPNTYSSHHSTVILVDVFVDIDGKAKEVKLSNPERRTSFNKFALLRAKNNSYPIKTENEQPISYWKNEVEITISASPKN